MSPYQPLRWKRTPGYPGSRWITCFRCGEVQEISTARLVAYGDLPMHYGRPREPVALFSSGGAVRTHKKWVNGGPPVERRGLRIEREPATLSTWGTDQH